MTRRTFLRVSVAALLLAVPVPTRAVSYVSFEAITVAATSIGFTTARIRPPTGQIASSAVCRLETAEIRWRSDGTAPTASVGTLLEPGDVIKVDDSLLMINFRAIRTTAVSGVLSCTYTAP